MLQTYDLTRRRTAILQNALQIVETQKINAVWTMEFKLSVDDPKNAYCQHLHYVRWGENGELYRIQKRTTERAYGGTVTYECEHVIATLIDNVLYGYHQVGNVGYYTQQVMQYILDRQMVRHWTLADCDYRRQYEYAWEQENLLAALWSVPECFNDDYIWRWDTTVYPWRLSLKQLVPDTPRLYVRAAKNMLTLTRTSEPSNLCTRLYPLGYGEGVNQLTIASVNGGKKYVQSPSDIILKYGIIERIWIDRRYQDANTLLSAAKAMLESLQEPYEQYSVSWAQVNGDPQMIQVGERVRIHDPESGTDYTNYIVQIKLDRLHPEANEIEVANATEDIASSVASLADRQRIETAYSQGATQIYSLPLQGNASKTNGLKLKFYLPEDMIYVNKIYASVELSPFRAYSKATESGGEASTEISAAQTTSSKALIGTTSAGGSGRLSTEKAGGRQTSDSQELPSENMMADDYGGLNAQNHNHGMTIPVDANGEALYRIALTDWSGQQILATTGFVPSGAHKHRGHSHTVDISHDHNIPSHDHKINLEHSHDIPGHTHKFSTKHSHEITPGIFTSGTPSAFDVYVDGQLREHHSGTMKDIDLITALTGSNGTISRGGWHTVEIRPDDLAYISICMYVQGFIQSRGESNA